MMIKMGLLLALAYWIVNLHFHIENELQQMYVIYCASSRRWLRDRIKDWPPLLTTLLWQYNRWELQLNEWIYYLVIDKKMNCCYSNHTLNYSKEYTGTKNEYIGNTLLLHQWHWPWMSVFFCLYWKGLHTLTTLKTFLYILEKVIQLPSQQN